MQVGDLMYMPSGMGGILPCVLVTPGDVDTDVRCIHTDFYPMQLVTVKTEALKPMPASSQEYWAKRAARARRMKGK